jgi:hypothetical protein
MSEHLEKDAKKKVILNVGAILNFWEKKYSIKIRYLDLILGLSKKEFFDKKDGL